MPLIAFILFSAFFLTTPLAWPGHDWHLGVPAIANAQAAKSDTDSQIYLGQFDDWHLWLERQEDRICVLSSTPTKSEGKYSHRGDIYLLVTRSTTRKSYGEVSFISGYSYANQASPRLVIDGDIFNLISDGERAWSKNEKSDIQIIKALRKGRNATVTGLSSRKTKTTDTLSLKGFTRGWKALVKNCPKQ